LDNTFWVVSDDSKEKKEFCTTLHIPEHAHTSQHNSGTCRQKPEHADTFPHGRGSAFSEAQAVV
jgi:hypothetical protein